MSKLPTTDEDWRKRLTPEQYRILRERGTEAPGSGEHLHQKADGTYECAGCGAALFAAGTKFDSGTGWLSFTKPATAEAVELRTDESFGTVRTEVVCRRCGGHLGHVFDDGPREQGGKRYCINSAALGFTPKD